MPAKGLGINRKKFDKCIRVVGKALKKHRRKGSPYAICTAALRKDR